MIILFFLVVMYLMTMAINSLDDRLQHRTLMYREASAALTFVSKGPKKDEAQSSIKETALGLALFSDTNKLHLWYNEDGSAKVH